MPGLYGIIGNGNKDVFPEMGTMLNHYGYKKDSYISEQLQLGRLHLATFFSSRQPVWDKEHKYGIMAEGYIIINNDISDSQARATETLERLVEWYKQEGDRFLCHIRTGVFNLIIIDLEHSRVRIINDRLGLLPLYYGFAKDNSLCFAPEEKALVQTSLVDKEIDWVGLSEYLYFYHPLHDRTFYQRVKLLSPATILSYDFVTKQSNESIYFDYPYHERDDLSKSQCVDLVCTKFQDACHRLHSPGNKYALLLSAGLDSRLILSSWESTENTAAYTFGMDNCLDVHISEQVASKKDVSHSVFYYSADTFQEVYEEAMWTMEHLRHVFVTSFAKYIKDGANNIAVPGIVGDTLLSGWHLDQFQAVRGLLSPLVFKRHPLPSRLELAKAIYKRSTPHMNRLLPLLLSEKAWQNIKEHKYAIYEDIAATTERYSSEVDCVEKAFEKWAALNVHRRAWQLQNIRIRYQLESAYPFCDYDFLDTVLSIPLELRVSRQLQLEIFQKRFPDMASIRKTHSYISAAHPYYLQYIDRCIFPYSNYLKGKINLLTKGRLPDVDGNTDFSRWFRESKRFNLLIRKLLSARPDLVNEKNTNTLLDECENYKTRLEPWLEPLLSYVLWWQAFVGPAGPD